MIPPLELHAEYASLRDARIALDDHLLQKGRTRVKVASNKRYRRYACAGQPNGCPFVCAFNESLEDGLWRVVLLEGLDHAGCFGEFRPGFRQVLEAGREFTIQRGDAVSAKDLRAHLAQKYAVTISKQTAYRTLEAIAAEKQGFAESVRLLPAMVERLKAEDPEGTYALVQREDSVFRGVFIMPSGFARLASTCKPVLAIDCANLKNSWHSGKLMFVVTQDAEGHNVVVAFAILDAEDTANYVWALELLRSNALLGEYLAHPDLTVVSDRGKGLESAVEQVLPFAGHLHCAKHIISNVHQHVHEAGQYFDTRNHASFIWKAQAAASDDEFEAALSELQAVNSLAAHYLRNIPPSTWTVHAFPRSLYGIRPKDMVEEMNSAVVKERGLESIVDMIKQILLKLLAEYDDHSLQARTFQGAYCPTANTMLQEQQELAAKYKSVKLQAAPGRYEAHVQFTGARDSHSSGNRPDERVVTIEDGHKISCTCQFPHSTKLPCRHVIAASTTPVAKLHDVVADECLKVPQVYSVENYNRGYQAASARVPRTDDLPASSSIVVPTLPEPASTKRRKPTQELADEKLSKRRRAVTCGTCGRSGHTKRTCKRVANTEQAASRETPATASSATSSTTTSSQLQADQLFQLELMRYNTMMLHGMRNVFTDPQLMAQLRS